MQSYSELVAEARACFLRAQEQGIKTQQDVIAFWGQAIALGQKLAMGSLARGVRFDQTDFDATTWKIVNALLKPFENAGCVERRCGERRGRDAFLLKQDITEEVLVATVRPKREYKKKPVPVVTKTVVEKGEERIVYRKPPRKEAKESRAVIVDIANVTKRLGPNGKPMLPINRINWHAFRNALQLHNGEMMPLERLVLCVSAHYATMNRLALSLAQRAGFAVVTKYGEKEADPVVGHQLRDVVITAVVKDYLERIPTIVLVSGDADFCGDIDDMRGLAKLEGLALPIHIVSWHSSLAHFLDLRASKTSALDDMLRQIRLP